jgi:membrane-associated protein
LELLKQIIDLILHIDKLGDFIHQYQSGTYIIFFIIIFAETGFVVTPFLPGDSLLFTAGLLIGNGNTGLNIFVLGLILIAAAFLGNTVNYYAGTYFGPKIFKEKNKILKLDYYLETKAFFDKHGGKAVILSRFMPIIRTIAPFVAGVGKMPVARYSLYNIIGGAAWITLFLAGGFYLRKVDFVKTHVSFLGFAIILLSVVPAIWAAVKARRAKKLNAKAN